MSETSQASYEAVLSRLSELYQTAVLDMESRRGRGVLEAYWEAGQLVSSLVGETARAAYGAKVVSRLAADLKQRLGRGFSERNLLQLRRFAREFSRDSLRPELSWTHYREVLRLRDPEGRCLLLERAANNGLTNPALKRLVDQELMTQGRLSRTLSRPSGELGLARVRRMAAVGGEASWLAVDLGFNVLREVSATALEGMRDGTLVHISNGARPRITAQPDVSSLPWLYEAWLERVVDGDTLLVQVVLGLGAYSRQKLRLRGLDAAELGTAEGEAAKESLQQRLSGCRLLVLKTHGTDKYQRYVADVLYQKRATSVERVQQSGSYLNQELLDDGLAARMTQ